MSAPYQDQEQRLASERYFRDHALGWFLAGFVVGLLVSAFAVVVYG